MNKISLTVPLLCYLLPLLLCPLCDGQEDIDVDNPCIKYPASKRSTRVFPDPRNPNGYLNCDSEGRAVGVLCPVGFRFSATQTACVPRVTAAGSELGDERSLAGSEDLYSLICRDSCVHGRCILPSDPLGQQREHCHCDPGYEGSRCERRTDMCLREGYQQCGIRGICRNEYGTYVCLCKNGKIGANCDEFAIENPCTPEALARNSTQFQLHPSLDKRYIKCMAPYTFSVFECPESERFDPQIARCVELGSCSLTGCMNGGQCIEMPPVITTRNLFGTRGLATALSNDAISKKIQFRCRCKPGFTGALCENKLDYCLTNPCKTGRCESGLFGPVCVCSDKTISENCESGIENPCNESNNDEVFEVIARTPAHENAFLYCHSNGYASLVHCPQNTTFNKRAVACDTDSTRRLRKELDLVKNAVYIWPEEQDSGRMASSHPQVTISHVVNGQPSLDANHRMAQPVHTPPAILTNTGPVYPAAQSASSDNSLVTFKQRPLSVEQQTPSFATSETTGRNPIHAYHSLQPGLPLASPLMMTSTREYQATSNEMNEKNALDGDVPSSASLAGYYAWLRSSGANGGMHSHARQPIAPEDGAYERKPAEGMQAEADISVPDSTKGFVVEHVGDTEPQYHQQDGLNPEGTYHHNLSPPGHVAHTGYTRPRRARRSLSEWNFNPMEAVNKYSMALNKRRDFEEWPGRENYFAQSENMPFGSSQQNRFNNVISSPVNGVIEGISNPGQLAPGEFKLNWNENQDSDFEHIKRKWDSQIKSALSSAGQVNRGQQFESPPFQTNRMNDFNDMSKAMQSSGQSLFPMGPSPQSVNSFLHSDNGVIHTPETHSGILSSQQHSDPMSPPFQSVMMQQFPPSNPLAPSPQLMPPPHSDEPSQISALFRQLNSEQAPPHMAADTHRFQSPFSQLVGHRAYQPYAPPHPVPNNPPYHFDSSPFMPAGTSYRQNPLIGLFDYFRKKREASLAVTEQPADKKPDQTNNSASV